LVSACALIRSTKVTLDLGLEDLCNEV